VPRVQTGFSDVWPNCPKYWRALSAILRRRSIR
jgi:hypothetical protein